MDSVNGEFPEILKIVGKRVKTRRNQLKLSQANLAERIGLSVEQIVKIEAGKINLSFGLILKLAKALSIEQKNCLLRQFT
jgi:transcriptional regulator with XRE-family HTH domain